MDSDNDYEDDYGLSKDAPWQCFKSNVSDRVITLYENGFTDNFTDVTLTFPGTDKTYDAHRLILAISSPVFAGILYGPMRTEGRNVLLHGDDSLAMDHVIAHCYGYDTDIGDNDIDITLEVYKLADKYLLYSLKKDCCEQIIDSLTCDPDMNGNEIIKFAERYNFTDLQSKCLPFLEKKFESALNSYDENECCIEKCGKCDIDAFEIVMRLSDEWIEGFLSKINFKQILDFHKSWQHPESPLEDNRLRTILSSNGCSSLNKFYGCINAEIIHLLPLAYISEGESLQLCLSVTDPHHAKRVIEAINQQNGFENNLIAIHMKIKDVKRNRKKNSCEEVWPRNCSPIRPDRTHRPSILLISDADDDKVSWVVEAAKAFLPQCEGSDTKLFKRDIDENIYQLKPVNILKLPRSNFTPNGFIKLLQELSISGVKCDRIYLQSPHISDALEERLDGFIHTLEHRGFNPRLAIVENIENFFRDVFDSFPIKYW